MARKPKLSRKYRRFSPYKTMTVKGQAEVLVRQRINRKGVKKVRIYAKGINAKGFGRLATLIGCTVTNIRLETIDNQK